MTKDTNCKISEEIIRKFMFEEHRELFDKFMQDVSFPNDYYSGRGIIIHEDAILSRYERDLASFKAIILAKQEAVREAL